MNNNNKHTDYLFIMYYHGRPIALDELMARMEPDGQITEKSYRKADTILPDMEEKGLIEARLFADKLYISLTEYGKEMALFAAEIVAEDMLQDWQTKALEDGSGIAI